MPRALDILTGVRPVLAALLLCVFVLAISVDGFACPDGCTDEAPTQAASQHPTASCAICHGWTQTPGVIADAPGHCFSARPAMVVITPAAPPLPRLERPPRPA